MNLQNIIDTTADPKRPFYVLLHKDQSHLMSLPGGEPDWSFNYADMELRKKILQKDFKDNNYTIVTGREAAIRISNKQAELVRAWSPTINLIRKAPTLGDRRAIYKRFYLSHKLPHPIEADGMLKRLLAW